MKPIIKSAYAFIILFGRKKQYFFTALAVIGVAGLCAAGIFAYKRNKAGQLFRQCRQASSKSIVETIYMNGLVSPSLSVNLTSEKTGRVSRLMVKEGSSVRQGQIVALLDSKDIDIQIQNKRREFAFLTLKAGKLETSAKRIISLAGKSVLPQSDIEEAEASVFDSRAELSRSASELVVLERERANNVIRSPFDGIVSQIFAFPGTFVSPMTSASDSEQSTKSTIMQIYSHIQVVLNAPEAMVFDILGSNSIFVSPTTDVKVKIPARIDRVMPYVILTSSKVSAIPIRLDVADPRPFLPGMNVDVQVEKPPVTGLAFSEFAIVKLGGRDGVLRCGGDRQSFVAVRTKGRGNGFVLVEPEGVLRDGFRYSIVDGSYADKPGLFSFFRTSDIKKIQDQLDVNPLR